MFSDTQVTTLLHRSTCSRPGTRAVSSQYVGHKRTLWTCSLGREEALGCIVLPPTQALHVLEHRCGPADDALSSRCPHFRSHAIAVGVALANAAWFRTDMHGATQARARSSATRHQHLAAPDRNHRPAQRPRSASFPQKHNPQSPTPKAHARHL